MSCHLSSFHALPLFGEVASVFPLAPGNEIPGVFWVLGAPGCHVFPPTAHNHLVTTHPPTNTHLDVLLKRSEAIRGCSGSHIDVGVVEELGGDVGAAFLLGRFWHVSITVPLPAGAVGIAGGWGGVLHPCGRHNSYRLACISGILLICLRNNDESVYSGGD